MPFRFCAESTYPISSMIATAQRKPNLQGHTSIDPAPQQQQRSSAAVQFADHRPDMVAQRKMQDVVQGSTQVKGHVAVQRMVDRHLAKAETTQLKAQGGQNQGQASQQDTSGMAEADAIAPTAQLVAKGVVQRVTKTNQSKNSGGKPRKTKGFNQGTSHSRFTASGNAVGHGAQAAAGGHNSGKRARLIAAAVANSQAKDGKEESKKSGKGKKK